MSRIANRNADSYVDSLEPFKGSNLFGQWCQRPPEDPCGTAVYAVYSYGYHYPALVFDPQSDQWFHNADGYSVSTARHQSRVGYRGEAKTTKALQDIIRCGGVANAVANRLAEAA